MKMVPSQVRFQQAELLQLNLYIKPAAILKNDSSIPDEEKKGCNR